MRTRANWRAFAFIHLFLMLVLSVGWVGSQWWLYASVGAMTDDLVTAGALDPTKTSTTSGG